MCHIAHRAVRACYAALRTQESVNCYGDELQRTHGVPVQIRVGLNSGAVVVRAIDSSLHMDYTAVGQTTHLAARMEQLALPGTIWLPIETVRLVEGYVEVAPLGPVPVKGMQEPVEVYELLRAGPVRSRLQAAVARGLTRLVGRDVELEHLRQALARAGAGHGQVVAGVGEAGVGKSRLLYEFTRSHHPHGWLRLASNSVSYGKATAYLPVLDLLKGYFQIEPQDDARRRHEKVTGKLLTLDRALEPMLPALLALLEVLVEDPEWHAFDPSQRRRRTLEAIKHLLLRQSQVQPLCLVFEDLHWIDAETQALLDSLVESLPTAQLLLLVNYRPEYQYGWSSKTCYTQLRLDPLPLANAEELLQALLGDDAKVTRLKQLLTERTEGNPFFLEESVRTLIETGVLIGECGAHRLAKPLDRLQVPATVQAVLAARIDRLPPEEKRLLQTAAVIGNEIPLFLLQTIAELSETALHRGLAHLQTGEFLYVTRLFPVQACTFKHALTHEVAYNSLLQARRRGLHGHLYLPQGDLEHAIQVSKRGLALCRASGNRASFLAIAADLGYAAALQGRLAEGHTLLEEAISEGIRTDGQLDNAYRIASLSEGWRRARRGAEAGQHAHQALNLARQQQARGVQVLALHQLGTVMAHADPSGVAQAGTHYRKALALAKALGMRPLQAHCHRGLGTLYAKTGRREEAQVALTTAIALYRSLEMTFWLPQAEAALARVEGR